MVTDDELWSRTLHTETTRPDGMTHLVSRHSGITGLVLGYLAAVIVLSPFLVVLYRLCVFHTVPYDDYAPFLLWLAGSDQGRLPDSPYVYRLGAMILAWPVFSLVPPVGFTNLPADTPAQWLRATLAINLISYLALVGAAAVTCHTAVRGCRLAPTQGLIAGMLVFILGWFTGIEAIDGVSLLLITLGIAWVMQPLPFALLAALSVGINEKVALVLAIWLAVRMLLVPADRARLAWPAAVAAMAVVAYFALVATLRMPGNEYQTNVAGFLGTIMMNLGAYASARGLALNIFPILILAAVAAWGHRTPAVAPFNRADVLTIPALMGVALVFTQFFQAGRIVMHAAPLFAIPAAAAIRTR